MKKNYLVYYCTPVESFVIKSFNSFEQAKEYCESEISGLEQVDGRDNVNYNNHHWFEIYEDTDQVDDAPRYQSIKVYND